MQISAVLKHLVFCKNGNWRCLKYRACIMYKIFCQAYGLGLGLQTLSEQGQIINYKRNYDWTHESWLILICATDSCKFKSNGRIMQCWLNFKAVDLKQRNAVWMSWLCYFCSLSHLLGFSKSFLFDILGSTGQPHNNDSKVAVIIDADN